MDVAGLPGGRIGFWKVWDAEFGNLDLTCRPSGLCRVKSKEKWTGSDLQFRKTSPQDVRRKDW